MKGFMMDRNHKSSKPITEERWRVSVYFTNREEAQGFKGLLESCNFRASAELVVSPEVELRKWREEVAKNG